MPRPALERSGTSDATAGAPEFDLSSPSPNPKSAFPTSSGRQIIDKGLPNSSAEERELWHEALGDVPPNDLRELLKLREQFGRLPRSLLDDLPAAHVPGSRPLEPKKSVHDVPKPSPIPSGPSTDDFSDSERVIRMTLAELAKGRQIIVNNIANAQSVGYKRAAVFFEPANSPASAHSTASARSPLSHSAGTDSLFSGLGARAGSPMFDMEQGRLRKTDRVFDLAIEGDGFFQVLDPGSGRTRYTRDGRFAVNAGGQLVLAVAGRDWFLFPPLAVAVGPGDFRVDANGTVRPQGQIVLARFADAGRLEPLGHNLFAAPDGLVPDVGAAGTSGRGRVRQSHLEESNVDLKQELEQLERLQRHVQALSEAARLLSEDGLGPRPTSAEQTRP